METGDTLRYYEMPPITVTDVAGTANYYFLDRNLGATIATTQASFDKALVSGSPFSSNDDAYAMGYWYIFSIGTPITIATTSNTNYDGKYIGWIPLTTGAITAPDNTVYTDTTDPCPTGYHVPTKTEIERLLTSSKYGITVDGVSNAGNQTGYINFRSDINAIWPVVRNSGNGGLNAPRNNGNTGIMLKEGYYFTAGLSSTGSMSFALKEAPFIVGATTGIYGVAIRCVRVENVP